MKNATVTIDYESFQEIKNKADQLEKLLKKKDEEEKERNEFIECLMNCIEKASEQAEAGHKQHFIAQGIKAIATFYEFDLKEEYGELDEGEKPL